MHKAQGGGRTTIVLGRIASGLLKEFLRPSPPALGQLGNGNQTLDLVAIAQEDSKYVADGDVVIGSVDYPDPIVGADIALDNYAQIRPGAKRLAKAARKRRPREQSFRSPNAPQPAPRSPRIPRW